MSFLATKLLAVLILIQSAAFDAVSIKPNTSGALGSETETTPGRVSLLNVTPISLIQRAFGLLSPQITGGPAWMASERYDVLAVTGGADALTDAGRQPFFRAMLADRWQFRFHWENKDLRVYSLIVAKTGSKLLTHVGPGEYSMKVQAAGGQLTLRSTKGNMGRLAEILTGQMNALVTNDTGLTEQYDFVLEWAPDTNPDAVGPSLITALQEQLGLRLDAVKKPMQVLVIDHIERPTEN